MIILWHMSQYYDAGQAREISFCSPTVRLYKVHPFRVHILLSQSALLSGEFLDMTVYTMMPDNETIIGKITIL